MSPRRSAAWYAQLASLTKAGITIPSAVLQAEGPKFATREKIAARLEAGDDPRELWPDAGRWLNSADALMLAAGQISGRFPEVCDELSRRHESRAKLRARMLMGALYPVFLLHAAAILAPFIRDVDFSGKNPATLAQILTQGAIGAVMNLAVIWGVVGAGWFLFEKFPPLRSGVLRVIPFWSGASRHASLASFAGTLASLLRAGVGIGQAWLFAGKVSSDPRLVAASEKIAAAVESHGTPPGSLLKQYRIFPDDFAGLYLAGEKSGKLEEQLDRLRTRHEEESVTRATIAAFVYPVLLTVLMMLLVGARVVSFWAKYYAEIEKLAK